MSGRKVYVRVWAAEAEPALFAMETEKGHEEVM